MNVMGEILLESWRVLSDSAPYVILGVVVAGLLKVFVYPGSVAKHLGKGRVSSVLKASLLGVPMPLCSCGALPAAASLKRQGANNGATAAFLIATPESGVDSISITYALLDPIMTVARPLAAMATAAAAGLIENFVSKPDETSSIKPDLSCPVDGCCDGVDCPADVHRRHHGPAEKVRAGLRYAFGELWGDLAGWFFIGILLSGVIGALIPEDVLGRYLGGGIQSMLIMLAAGVPIYICATSSTPIAAALILKGVSPGAALVFLLAGPATNLASLTVLVGVLGKRATAIYLTTIAVFAVGSGLVVDYVYAAWGIEASAAAGHASEFLPAWAKVAAAAALIAISVRPIGGALGSRLGLVESGSCPDGHCHLGHDHHDHDHHDEQGKDDTAPTCGSGQCRCSHASNHKETNPADPG